MAELALLHDTSADEDGFFICGDTAQTITRGVGFRFTDVKLLFGGRPKLAQLKTNFRTHAGPPHTTLAPASTPPPRQRHHPRACHDGALTPRHPRRGQRARRPRHAPLPKLARPARRGRSAPDLSQACP